LCVLYCDVFMANNVCRCMVCLVATCSGLPITAITRYTSMPMVSRVVALQSSVVQRQCFSAQERSAMQAQSCMRIGRCQGFKVKQRNHALMSQSGARGVPGLLRVRLMKFFFKETEHWPCF